jgi:hypothetical protein
LEAKGYNVIVFMFQTNKLARAMITDNSNQPGMTWLVWALLTVLCWGVYGVFLHTGQTQMKPLGATQADPAVLRYKAFLFVGIAYFLVAVLAPLLLLISKGAAFSGYTSKGVWWSLVAGIVGALGAFGELLAFGAKGTPAVVMAIVFAGAPVVNAIYSLMLHPPSGGWGSIKWQFYLGIILAAVGGCLVTKFKPAPSPVPARPAAAESASSASSPGAAPN